MSARARQRAVERPATEPPAMITVKGWFAVLFPLLRDVIFADWEVKSSALRGDGGYHVF